MKERSFWIGFLLLMAVALAGPPDTAALSPTAPAAVALAAQDTPKPSVDINITTTRSDEWYKNPIIVGAGVVILVLLVALASRGGSGTTVVKS